MSTAAVLQAVNGISLAALLFLLSSGFTLTFGLMRVVNMAYGAYYLLAAMSAIPWPEEPAVLNLRSLPAALQSWCWAP